MRIRQKQSHAELALISAWACGVGLTPHVTLEPCANSVCSVTVKTNCSMYAFCQQKYSSCRAETDSTDALRKAEWGVESAQQPQALHGIAAIPTAHLRTNAVNYTSDAVQKDLI